MHTHTYTHTLTHTYTQIQIQTHNYTHKNTTAHAESYTHVHPQASVHMSGYILYTCILPWLTNPFLRSTSSLSGGLPTIPCHHHSIACLYNTKAWKSMKAGPSKWFKATHSIPFFNVRAPTGRAAYQTPHTWLTHLGRLANNWILTAACDVFLYFCIAVSAFWPTCKFVLKCQLSRPFGGSCLCSRSCICYVPLQFPFSNYFPHSQSFQIMQTAQLAPLLGGGITFYLSMIDQGSETQTSTIQFSAVLAAFTDCRQLWQFSPAVNSFDQQFTALASFSFSFFLLIIALPWSKES